MKKNVAIHRNCDKKIEKPSFSLSDAFSYPDNYLNLRVLRNKELYEEVDIKILSMKQNDSYFHKTYSVLRKIDQNYFGNAKETQHEVQNKKTIEKKQIVGLSLVFLLLIFFIIGLAVVINGK